MSLASSGQSRLDSAAASAASDFAEGVVAHASDVVLTRLALSAPVFYAVAQGRVLVSSRLAPLVASLERRPALSVERLASLVAIREPDDPSATPYASVYRVPAQCQVRVWPDGRRQVTVVAHMLSPADCLTPEDAALEIRKRLFASIARQTRDKKRVAVLVGGGVDSSSILASVLAVTRGASRPEVDAITLHYGAQGDDRPYMRDLARALGIVPIRLSPSHAAPLVRRMLVADGAPYTWPDAACEGSMLLAARERGAEIAIGGVGGDDLFDGDPLDLALDARNGHPLRALRDACALHVPWTDRGLGQAWHFVVRPFLVQRVPAALRRWRRLARGKRAISWAGPELRAFLERLHARPIPERPRSASARYTGFVTRPYLMDVSDMRAQLHAELGIARVDPFLDVELIEFVSSLPPSMLLHGGRVRGLLRAAMRDLVPDSVRLRTDKAHVEPALTEAVRAGGGFAMLRDLLPLRNLERLGLVNPQEFGATFEALAADPENWGNGWLQVWPVLAVEAFLVGLEGAK